MVQITVKTLDGQDRSFDVSDDLTVNEFKQHISPVVGIVPESQRIIFQGKVLQDSKKLNEFNLNGKAVHLVEKPPNRPSELPRNTVLPHHHANVRREVAQQQVMIGNVAIPVSEINREQLVGSIRRVLDRLGDIGRRATMNVNQSPDGNVLDVVLNIRGLPAAELESPAYARVQHVRHVLHHINQNLTHIENDDDLSAARSPTSLDDTVSEEVPSSSVQDASANSSADVQPKETSQQSSHATDQTSPNASAHDLDGVESSDGAEPGSRRNQRIRDAMVSDLADVFDHVIRLQDRLRPHMNRYLSLLRNEVDYQDNIEEGRRASRFFSSMQIVMHNVSHVYHVISDLDIHLCQTPPRILQPRFNETGADITMHETEAQITMSFRRQTDSNGGANERTTGATSGGTDAANANDASWFNPGGGDVAGANLRYLGQQLGANFGINNAQTPPQGRVSVQVTPQGVVVSQAQTASFTVPMEQRQSQQQGQFIGANSGGNGAGVDQGAQTQNQQQAPSFFQQLMQGVANAGVILGLAPTMAGARQPNQQAAQGGSGSGPQGTPPLVRPRPGVSFPQVPPTGGFQFGGRFPAMWPGSPQNMARLMRARESGGFGLNAMPQQQQRPQHVHQNVGFGQRQPHPIQRPGVAQTVIVNTSNADPVFIGPRPPSDLPLFTVDQFLPCPSRHFDMRTRSPMLTRRNDAATSAAPSNVSGAAPASGNGNQAAGDQSSASHNDGLVDPLADIEEFEAAVDRILRSVLEGMNNQPITNPSSLGSRSHKLYNFVPVGNSLAAQEGRAYQPPLVSGLSTSVGRPSPSQSPSTQRGSAGTDQSSATNDASVATTATDETSNDMGNMIGRLFERLIQTPNATVADIMLAVGREIEEPGTSVFSNITNVLTHVLTFTDLIPLIRGVSVAPLDSARTPLRRYFIENVLNGNDRPSEEDLRQASSRAVAEDLSQFQTLVNDLPVVDNVDLANSMLTAFEARLMDVLKLCFGFSDATNFGQTFYDIGWLCMQEIVSLGVHFTENGTHNFEEALVNYLNSGTTGMPVDVQNMMGISSREHVRTMITNYLLPKADVQQYVVYGSPDASTDNQDIAAPSTVEIKMDAASAQQSLGKENLKRSAPDDTAVPEVELNTPRASGSVEIKRTPVDEEWKQHLPPDWVKVVEVDVERQRSQPAQRPFSDAYLNGMPLKRRKIVCESKPNVSIDSETLLRSVLQTSVNETACVPVTGELTEDVINASTLSASLLESLDDNVSDKVRRRLQNDPDFDEKRFPNVKKLFDS